MIWRSCLFFLSSVAPIRSGQSTGVSSLLPQTASMRAISKHPSPRRSWRMVRGSLLGLSSALLWALPGAALPQNGTVSTGQVEIQQPNAERLNIMQTSERAIINWNSFNIGSSEWVNFQQPSATSATLNRVTGGFTSEIAGRLTANGQVYLVNPNGILFTPTAQVNVSSFLATTLDIQNTDFMQGQLRFRQTLGKALSTVENEGNITVAEGGFAALVAPGVANRGVMNAYLGSVVLGSGTEATLDFYGDGLFSFAVDPTLTGQIFGATGQSLNALVSNSGVISADGGVVRLSAQAGASVVKNVINMDGVILARTAENRQGTIVLSGGNTGTIAVSGTLDVSGQTAGQMGGAINVLGNQVNLIEQAQLLASGDSGGGTVLVGGDYQGKGKVPTATTTTVNDGVEIKADALTNGQGGKVIVWADGVTTMNGRISAKGGATSGNGGFVETSGKAGLSIASTASVNVGAANGASGSWLLDPDRLFIDSNADNSNTLPAPLTGDYFVASSVVEDALSKGNVTLAANDLIQVDTTINSSAQLNSNVLKFSDQNADGNLVVNLKAPIILAPTQTLTGEATIVNVAPAAPGILQNGVNISASGATLNLSSGTFTGIGDNVVVIDKSLTIRGEGADATVIDGQNQRRVFNIAAGTVNIEGLRISNGNIDGFGGGILIGEDSNATVRNSIISNNSAFFVPDTSGVAGSFFEGNGGGIFNNRGTLSVINSTINSNTSANTGGGITNIDGTVTITNSSLVNNIASGIGDNGDGAGGGISNLLGSVTIVNSLIANNSTTNDGLGGGVLNLSGTINIFNSTISGNSAGSEGIGGGIFNVGNTDPSNSQNGIINITNSTITTNSASSGGAIYNDLEGVINVSNSILAGNIAPSNSEIFNEESFNSPEFSANGGVLNSLGFNLVGQNGNAGGFLVSASDIVLGGSIDTVIAPLALNGGQTPNFALVAGSPAIDAGSSAPGVTTDQRGAPRPVGAANDIGSFEFGSSVPSPIDPPPAPPIDPPPAPPIDPPPAPPIDPPPAPPIDPPPALPIDPPPAPPIDPPPAPPIDPPPAPPIDQGSNESSTISNNVSTVLENSPSSSTETFPPLSPTIPQPNGSPLASAAVQELDQYFSASVTGYLGLNNVPVDTIDQAKNTLSQISTQVAGVTPSLIYTYFAPTPKAQTAAKLPPTLIASAEPLSGLLAQASEPKADKCLSEKPARPTDPIWQFDSCGWDRIFPKGAAGNENDQLVLVLVTSDGKVIRKQIADATRGKMVKAVRRFQGSLQGLQDSKTYLPQSQQLYRWLVAPLEESLKTAKVNNLVFIMDRGLRALPLAALHDGTGFIVERYSVGVMPSLTLTDTRYVNLQQTQVLAMGASEFKDLASLPAVPLELSTISKLWSGQSLLNETFTPQQLKQLRSSKPYGIVHLATHGEFQAGNPEQSYIQFWDTKVNLKQMQSLNLTQPSPVSLLVLSACRTALGDQDAELGFTGLAVSAGVQTALGGLWNISDLGTLALMSSFYSNLKVAPIKAEALRQAQVAMLKGQVRVENNQLMTAGLNIPLSSKLQEQSDANLAHPYYWSGITMVGNPW
jgi:filamentous hemagglutinin family protein